MRYLRSLKSTHWVIWSSPLLLVVLVFTLTASSNSTLHVRSTSTTTSTTTPTRLDGRRHVVASPSKTSRKRSPAKTPVPTDGPSDVASSSSTASSDEPIASASAESAASGALTGQLGPSFESAEVAYEGPGTWTIAASAPLRAALLCSGTVIAVTSEFTVGAQESCQLTLSLATPGSALTWQVTPVY